MKIKINPRILAIDMFSLIVIVIIDALAMTINNIVLLHKRDIHRHQQLQLTTTRTTTRRLVQLQIDLWLHGCNKSDWRLLCRFWFFVNDVERRDRGEQLWQAAHDQILRILCKYIIVINVSLVKSIFVCC